MSNSSCRWETENHMQRWDGVVYQIKLHKLINKKRKKKGLQVDWLIVSSRLSRIPKNDYQMFSTPAPPFLVRYAGYKMYRFGSSTRCLKYLSNPNPRFVSPVEYKNIKPS